ncbi:DUF4836 family protein [Flavobacterium jejuense]|uniref:DUF4836 family protein n=1 Tax=Flavobacterium jejuense TaxID=1544455 RepID=A0ABX0IPB1_9FLAO|nr:hypothetical protein [Flavobacterium jejuense]NHN25637.1 DUF4836 family protein [Flavobacterium jejuense]
MKKQLHVLLLLASTFVFSQLTPKELDYFVQFNGSQFSKKVSLDEILNHDAIKKISNSKSDFNIKEYTSLIRMDKDITIHGNFSSKNIPFYQITIPIKNREEVRTLLTKKNEEDRINTKDSITAEIIDYELYSVFNDPKQEFSIAWNNDYLIFIEFIKPISNDNGYSNLYNTSPVYDEEVIEVAETEEAVEYNEEEYREEEIIIQSTEVEDQTEWEEVEVVEAPVDDYDYNYNYEEENNEYLKQIEEEKQRRKEMQNEHIAFLFDDGFVVPTSDKINLKADISAWVNYQSAFNSMKDFSGIVKSMVGGSRGLSSDDIDSFIKGVNFNMYFENKNARIEQTIEYSKSLADIMTKVVNRKINKNIFKYFPNQTPMAYMSYHINSEELLRNFPSITAQMYNDNRFLKKEDMEIVTDLISTMLDEKAIASLFDGDFTVFLHDISEQEYTYKSYEYDEDYNEIEVEKTDKRTTPIFTVLFTSTHRTMGNKLLDLAERRKVLIKEKQFYKVRGSEKEMGDLRIIKDGDVVVITNGLSFISNSNSNFTINFKQQIKKNYMFGDLNLKKLMEKYASKENLGKDASKMRKVSQQFEKIDFKSSKKMENNKLQFEMSLHSSSSDKNIILQTLDLVTFLSTK